MRANVLFEKIRAGDVVLGLGNMYPAPGIIEGMCKGWDFVWIDGQHGQLTLDSSLHALHAASAIGIDTVLRVPGHEYGILGPFADLAPSAVMVPMVNDAKQAENVVRGLRFPPLGERSYGGRRVIDVDGREYYRAREMILVAQIETFEAVENADQIAATQGIDALFFGPDDMKVRMEIDINASAVDNKQLRGAMEQTAKVARAAGKACGTVAPSVKAFQIAVDMGYQIVVGGADVMFLRAASARMLSDLHATLKEVSASGTDADSGGGVYGR